jgi:hypothetical protein
MHLKMHIIPNTLKYSVQSKFNITSYLSNKNKNKYLNLIFINSDNFAFGLF